MTLPVWWGHVCLLKSQIQASDTRVAPITEHWGCTRQRLVCSVNGMGWGVAGAGAGRGDWEVMEGFHRERAFLAEGLACEQAE